jgi:hypothetical protein
MSDKLFAQLEEWQAGSPWGRVLDAGTGEHSLRWLTGLKTERWSAVTGDVAVAASLRERFAQHLRPCDELVAGNWTDPALLQGQRFDVVLADYLVGAIDGFAPYFQDQIFARLRPLVGQHLFLIGLEPFPDVAPSEGGQLILEVARLRDACILLAGHRCYREYPLDWVLRQLAQAGFAVQQHRLVPIVFGERYVRGQLGVCRRKLPLLRDRALAQELERHVQDLERRALQHLQRSGGVHFGHDYVVWATPAEAPR